MGSTRRAFCVLAATVVGGCVSDPGASCRGATVRLSLRPATPAESPLELDPERLSAEAVAVVETAIADEHVERCVAWEPGDDETGPSMGLSELVERIEDGTGTGVTAETEHVEIDVRFRGDGYELVLVAESEA